MNHCQSQIIVKNITSLIGSGELPERYCTFIISCHCGSISKSHILGVLYYTCEDIEQRKWWGELCFNNALQKLKG